MANMRKKAAAPSDTSKEEKTVATVTASIEDSDLRVIVQQQQDQIRQLTDLVRKTSDSNRIRQYERDNKEFEGFAFSIKTLTNKDGTNPRVVTRWETAEDFVADEGRIVSQRIRIFYQEIDEISGEMVEKSKEIALTDFVRILKRTPPIIASALQNLDGTPVRIDFRVNPETKKKNAFLQPD